MQHIKINNDSGRSLLIMDGDLNDLTAILPPECRLFIITDTNVRALYGSRFPVGDVFVVKPGEQSKTLAVIGDLKGMSPRWLVGSSFQANNVLKTLSYREREIIKLRYGLGDGYSYTLEEVGHIFKVTRERIRQIEAKAVRKLQQPSRSQELVGFLD